MAHGPLHGNKHGARHGAKHGSLLLANTITWTTDATSGKGVPANATEWASVRTAASLGAGAPSNLHLYQEAAGSPADSIGSMTMTPGGAGHTYQQNVTGWARKAFKLTQAVGQYAGVTSGAPNLASESGLYFAYIDLPSTPSGNRDLISASPALFCRVTTGDKLQLSVSGVTVDSTNSHVGIGGFPVVMAWNRALSKVKLYTHLEKITGTWDAAMTGDDYIVGAYAGAASAVHGMLYDTIFKGAAAELGAGSEAAFDAAVKSILTALGYTIPWS